MKKVREQWRLGLLIVIAGLALTPFFSSLAHPWAHPPARAAVSQLVDGLDLNWVDRTHIQLDQPTSPSDTHGFPVYQAVDGRLDYHYTFDLTGGEASNAKDKLCYLHIEFHNVQGNFPSGTDYANDKFTEPFPVSADFANKFGQATVTYGIAQGPPSNSCLKTTTPTPVTVGDLNNFNITFRWIDINTIRRVDADVYASPLSFSRNPTGPSGSTYTDSNGVYGNKGATYAYFTNPKDSTNCQDFLLAPTGKAVVQAGYYEQLQSGNNATDPIANGQCGIYRSYSDQQFGNAKGLPSFGRIDVGGFTPDIASQTPCTGDACQATAPAPVTPPTASCEIPGGFGWLLCPVINVVNNFFTQVEKESANLLALPALTVQNYAGAYAVWNALRSITNVFFVLIFLVIIFSNTLSVGLDNYDIKKMLPRLVTAAILVQFSWVIMQLAIDISNILGAGISSILTTAIPHVNTGPSSFSSTISSTVDGIGLGIGLVGAALIGLLGPILLAFFGFAISVLAVLVTLELRKLVLVILIVVAPLAFLAWILPNTESMFKTWSKLLTRLLLMYPLIILIFAMASVAQSITANGGNGQLEKIVAAILPTAAFFMVPWTFKWAGGAMSAIGGAVTARASGWSKSAKAPLNKRVGEIQKQRSANKTAERQIKAGELFGGGRLGQLRAKGMTGNFGRPGSAKLAAMTRAAQGDQVKAEANMLAVELERKPNDRQKILAAAAGDGSNQFRQQAAFETMIDQSMFHADGDKTPGLTELYGTGPGKFDETNTAWQRARQNKWNDIQEKSGFLLEKGSIQEKMEAFSANASESQISTTKPAALEAIRDYGTTTAWSNMSDKIAKVKDNARLMTNVREEQLKAFQEIQDKAPTPASGTGGSFT